MRVVEATRLHWAFWGELIYLFVPFYRYHTSLHTYYQRSESDDAQRHDRLIDLLASLTSADDRLIGLPHLQPSNLYLRFKKMTSTSSRGAEKWDEDGDIDFDFDLEDDGLLPPTTTPAIRDPLQSTGGGAQFDLSDEDEDEDDDEDTLKLSSVASKALADMFKQPNSNNTPITGTITQLRSANSSAVDEADDDLQLSLDQEHKGLSLAQPKQADGTRDDLDLSDDDDDDLHTSKTTSSSVVGLSVGGGDDFEGDFELAPHLSHLSLHTSIQRQPSMGTLSSCWDEDDDDDDVHTRLAKTSTTSTMGDYPPSLTSSSTSSSQRIQSEQTDSELSDFDHDPEEEEELEKDLVLPPSFGLQPDQMRRFLHDKKMQFIHSSTQKEVEEKEQVEEQEGEGFSFGLEISDDSELSFNRLQMIRHNTLSRQSQQQQQQQQQQQGPQQSNIGIGSNIVTGDGADNNIGAGDGARNDIGTGSGSGLGKSARSYAQVTGQIPAPAPAQRQKSNSLVRKRSLPMMSSASAGVQRQSTAASVLNASSARMMASRPARGQPAPSSTASAQHARHSQPTPISHTSTASSQSARHSQPSPSSSRLFASTTASRARMQPPRVPEEDFSRPARYTPTSLTSAPARPSTPTTFPSSSASRRKPAQRFTLSTAASRARAEATRLSANTSSTSSSSPIPLLSPSSSQPTFASVAASGMKMLKRPKNVSTVYGDGTELDSIDSLPVDTSREHRANTAQHQQRHPLPRRPNVQQGTGTIGRNSSASATIPRAQPPTQNQNQNQNQTRSHPPLQSHSIPRSANPASTSSASNQTTSHTGRHRRRRSRKSNKSTSHPQPPPQSQPHLIRHLGTMSSTSKPPVMPGWNTGEMSWDSSRRRWKGNESVLRDFDNSIHTSMRPGLITQLGPLSPPAATVPPPRTLPSGTRIVGDMIFDPIKMCWLHAKGVEEEEDPFAQLDDEEDTHTRASDVSLGEEDLDDDLDLAHMNFHPRRINFHRGGSEPPDAMRTLPTTLPRPLLDTRTSSSLTSAGSSSDAMQLRIRRSFSAALRGVDSPAPSAPAAKGNDLERFHSNLLHIQASSSVPVEMRYISEELWTASKNAEGRHRAEVKNFLPSTTISASGEKRDYRWLIRDLARRVKE
ncbi:unnamed protein product [Sympodiomycopsis kandeliae]